MGVPVLFVAKWIDYTNRYGFGCLLSDGSLCVAFLDGSKLCSKYVSKCCWEQNYATGRGEKTQVV